MIKDSSEIRESDDEFENVKRIMLSNQQKNEFKHYINKESERNSNLIINPSKNKQLKQINLVRNNITDLLKKSLANSTILNTLMIVFVFFKFVITFIVLVLFRDYYDNNRWIYIILILYDIQNLSEMIYYIVILYHLANDKQDLIQRVASNYQFNILRSHTNNEFDNKKQKSLYQNGMSKVISLSDLIVPSNTQYGQSTDDKQKYQALLNNHSLQNLRELKKSESIFQNSLKSRHFTQQVRKSKSVQFLSIFCKCSYLILFILGNVLVITQNLYQFNDDSKQLPTIVLLIHLVIGYVAFTMLMILFLVTTLASPFLLGFIIYIQINKQKKKSQQQKTIQKLKAVDFTSEYENKQCSICLNVYEQSSRIYPLNCNHHFHDKCLQQWFMVTTQCPVCRNDYFQMNYYLKIFINILNYIIDVFQQLNFIIYT